MRLAAAQFGSYVDTSPLHSGGPVNDHIQTVYTPLFWISVVVFVAVSLAIIYFALRFRRRHDDEEPTQVHGNNRLEVAWTVTPFVILVSLFTLTAANMSFISSAPAGAMKVCVVGQRFSWTFIYEDSCGSGKLIKGENGGDKMAFPPPTGTVQSGTTLYIPVGKPVALDLVSSDVAHSFYIPSLAGQMNAMPGQVNHMWLQADQPGTYYGQCTELCGVAHANMLLQVTALPQDKYDAWYQQKQQSAAASGAGGS